MTSTHDSRSRTYPPCEPRGWAIEPRDLFGAVWVTALAIGLFTLSSTVRGATYKWVDDKGVVHYTDKIPTEAVNKGSTLLDKQARPLKKIDPPPTAAELRAREEENELRRLNAKAQEETARRDRALIASYTNESEIDLVRSRSLGTIDAQIESSQAYLVQLTKRREELEQRKAKVGDKPLPAALERELEGNDSELGKTAGLIEQKRRERGAVVARYDADKLRWRELKAISEANAAAAAATPRSHPGAFTSNGSTASPRK